VVNLTLEQGYSFSTMILVALIACALTGLFYYRAFGMLPRGRWQLLLGLRILAILLVIVLLFRPVFSYYKELDQKPGCVFLLDTSASMSIADDPSGVTRFNQARGQIEKWWERLENDFSLHLVEFSDRASAIEGPKAMPGLTPDGASTSISRALSTGRSQQKQRKDIEAIILLSDGQHNSAGSPLDEAIRAGVRIHTVGVGASLRSNVSHRDLQLTGMDCPERLLLNNIAKIKASVDGIGLDGRVVKVVLEEDDQQIAEKELTIDDIEGTQEVEFEYRPTVKGRHKYAVKVLPQPDEKILENNQRSTTALVVEPGIRVLYIEGTLRAEYGAIVDRFLSKDPDLEFCALVQTRPNVFLRRTNIPDMQMTAIPTDAETINKFDVFILGDLDATYLRPAVQELILKRVRENGGLVMLGGYHSLGPGGYGGTPIGDALPVRLGGRDVGQITDPLLPTLTPDGVRHAIFANIAAFFPTRQSAEPQTAGLPTLNGCTRVEGLKPNATALATYTADEDAMPILAVGPLDKGRMAVFCGDTTRNWQQGPRAMDQESPFTRFWGQMVRWLAGRSASVETGVGISASTNKAAYEPDEAVQLAAVVRNQEGQGARDAQVVAKIREPSGRPEQIKLEQTVGPAGHFGGNYTPQIAGTYEIEIEARVGEQTVTAEKIVIEVGRPNLEFERLDLNQKLLEQIASDSGGRYLHISASDHLIDQLDRSVRRKKEYYEKELYFPPLFWLLFVGLITTEWMLRKKFQLR
jgi:uncharacterized membrane protein